jgi:hypothetical protein
MRGSRTVANPLVNVCNIVAVAHGGAGAGGAPEPEPDTDDDEREEGTRLLSA